MITYLVQFGATKSWSLSTFTRTEAVVKWNWINSQIMIH